MQKDSFQVIKEVFLGSLPFHGSFPFSSRLKYKPNFAKVKHFLCACYLLLPWVQAQSQSVLS